MSLLQTAPQNPIHQLVQSFDRKGLQGLWRSSGQLLLAAQGIHLSNIDNCVHLWALPSVPDPALLRSADGLGQEEASLQ